MKKPRKEKIYLARNDIEGSMFYDLRLFGEDKVAEANEHVKKLNKFGPKGWVLVKLEDN